MPAAACPGKEGYDGWTVWKCPGDARGTLADDGSIVGSRRGVPCFVVLAAAAMARIWRGSGDYGALALAGGDSVGAGIRGCSALHLGLRVDGTRQTCADRDRGGRCRRGASVCGLL